MAHIRRHPRSGRWQVRYIDPDRRERSRNFERKPDAEAFAATVTADVLRGDYVDPSAGRITFAEYSSRWQSTRADIARSTRDRDGSLLRSIVLPHLGHRSVASIRPSELGVWLASLNHAPSTRAKALRLVHGVLELARSDGGIKTNPAADVKPPRQEPVRVGQALSDAQIAELIRIAEAVDQRTAAMVVVMARCGLRVSEAIALRRSDVDFGAGTIRVVRTMSRREGLRPVKGEKRQGRVGLSRCRSTWENGSAST